MSYKLSLGLMCLAYLLLPTSNLRALEIIDTITFTVPGVLAFQHSEEPALVDPAERVIYYLTGSRGPRLIHPGDPVDVRLLKLDLGTFTIDGSLVLGLYERNFTSPVIVPADRRIYLADCGVAPPQIIRVDLNTFTVDGRTTLNTDDECPLSAIADGQYAYFAIRSMTSPRIKIVRIRLSTFRRDGELVLPRDPGVGLGVIGWAGWAFKDPAGPTGYFVGGWDLHPYVYKVNLATFRPEDVSYVTFPMFSTGTWGAGYDPVNNYLYLALMALPGEGDTLLRLTLPGMSLTGVLALPLTDQGIRRIVVDPANDYAYLGVTGFAMPPGEAKIVKVNVRPGQPMVRVEEAILDPPGWSAFIGNAALDPDGNYGYFGVLSSIVKAGLNEASSAPPGPPGRPCETFLTSPRDEGPVIRGALGTVPRSVPLCRCLEHRDARSLRCRLIDPNFVLEREVPFPIPPREKVIVKWSLYSEKPLGQDVRIVEQLPKGLRYTGKEKRPELVFRKSLKPGRRHTLTYEMEAPETEGHLRTLSQVWSGRPEEKDGQTLHLQTYMTIWEDTSPHTRKGIEKKE